MEQHSVAQFGIKIYAKCHFKNPGYKILKGFVFIMSQQIAALMHSCPENMFKINVSIWYSYSCKVTPNMILMSVLSQVSAGRRREMYTCILWNQNIYLNIWINWFIGQFYLANFELTNSNHRQYLPGNSWVIIW